MSRFWQISLSVVCAMLFVLVVPADRCPGATRTWTGNIDNDWYDGLNWNPTGGPDPADILSVLSGGSPETPLDVTTDGGGSITVNGSGAGASADFGGDLYVAEDGAAALNIQNGGSVSNFDCYIGYFSTGVGEVTVTGAKSTWTNSGNLDVGGFGTGTLEILDDGDVTSNGASIAFMSGSEGTVRVDGTGSTWTNNSYLVVGASGTGTLDILNGGSASNTDAFLGYFASGDGTVTVDGVGSTWTNSGSLYIGGDSISAVGTGAVIVQNDGLLKVGGTLKLWSTGTLTLDGGTIETQTFDRSSGTFNWTSGTVHFTGDLTIDTGEPFGDNVQVATGQTLDVADDLTVGNVGTGTLQISSGGSVSNSVGRIGYLSTGVGTVTVTGSGSTWTNSSSLYVGRYGTGTLEISNGGSVSNNFGYIAYFGGSTGAVTVTGTGSTWMNSGSLIVGDEDTGTLDILNGGSVSNVNAYLGRYSATGDGTVTVDGTGSKWENSGSLYIGGDSISSVGTGAVIVQNDGQLEVGGTLKLWSTGTLSILGCSVTCGSFDNSDVGTFTFTGGTMTVDGGSFDPGTSDFTLDGTGGPTLTLINGATMNLPDNLYLGSTDSGSLNIESGSSVSNDYGYIGYGSGSVGAVTVDGAYSTWTNTGSLYVGRYGTGTLDISNGGSVSNNFGYIAYYSGSSGAVTVTGAGSMWTNNGSLIIGDEDIGTLDILDGGSVSNTDAYLGRWSASGDGTVTVDGANSTWTNSGSMHIGGNGTNSKGAGTVVVGVGGEVQVGTGGSGDVIAYNDACSISMNGGKMAIAGGFATTGGGSGTRAALNYQFDDAGMFGQIVCEPTGQTANISDVVNTGTITYSLLGGGAGGAFAPTAGGCMDFLVAETISDVGATDNMAVLLASGSGSVNAGEGYGSWSYGKVTIDDPGGPYDGYDALRLAVLPGDASQDGTVDGSDLAALLANWGGMAAGANWTLGDFDYDDDADGADLAIILANWNKVLGTCDAGAAAVPEPMTLCLLGLGGLALLRRRRS